MLNSHVFSVKIHRIFAARIGLVIQINNRSFYTDHTMKITETTVKQDSPATCVDGFDL